MNKPIYLYVTPFFPRCNSWRGAYCLDFVKALQRDGRYDIRVFVPNVADYEIEGVRVYGFRTKELPSGILPFAFRRYNACSFLSKVRFVLELTTNDSSLTTISVCHAHTARYAIYPLAIKRENARCLTLLHHHDLQSFGLNIGILRHCALYNAVLFCQMRTLFEQMDGHVFISEKSRESFLAAPNADWTIYEDYKKQMRGPKFFHCRPVRIKCSIILYNGVDTSIFHPVDCTEYKEQGTAFTIGCIGNFTEVKDQMTVLKAVERLDDSNVNVRFVGSGPLMGLCQEYVRQHGLQGRVTFENEVVHEKLAQFYRSIDLFVLPSIFEGFGCVYAESWCCGLPFVACEGQGVVDLIPENERSRWLCRPHDADGLARIIDDYRRNRYPQALTRDITIDKLVTEFLEKIH